MIFVLFLIGLAFVSCNSTRETEDKLVFAQVVFRHGDRTIRKTYKNDPYKNKSFWPEGFGQLTNLGKQQEYELGQYFGFRYKNLLGDGYSPGTVYAISSELDRSMNSAALVLAGLFPPKSNQIWNSNLLWQPIPVHVISRSRDHLIIAETACAKYKKVLKDYQISPEVKAVTDEYQDVYEYIEKHAGQRIDTLENVKDFYGILDVELMKNLTLPEWTNHVIEDSKFLSEYWLKVNSGTTELRKLKGGFLFKEILDRFSKKIHSTLSPDYKLYLYSGHDITVAAILSSLGLFEMDLHTPPYSSSILFELYKTHTDQYYLQIFYRKSTTEEPTPLIIPGCGTKCSLHQMYELFNEVLPTDYETDCKLH